MIIPKQIHKGFVILELLDWQTGTLPVPGYHEFVLQIALCCVTVYLSISYSSMLLTGTVRLEHVLNLFV